MGNIKGGKKQNTGTLLNWSNRSLAGIAKRKKRENLGHAILNGIMAEQFLWLKKNQEYLSRINKIYPHVVLSQKNCKIWNIKRK